MIIRIGPVAIVDAAHLEQLENQAHILEVRLNVARDAIAELQAARRRDGDHNVRLARALEHCTCAAVHQQTEGSSQ